MAIFACLTALLALAARGRHLQSLLALGGRPPSNAGSATNPLPFNTVASFTTSSIVIGLVVLLVMVKLVRSMGWRRALHRLRLHRPTRTPRRTVETPKGQSSRSSACSSLW